MDLPASFGLWLKARRKQLDLTQSELADRTSCTVATIRKIEADERRPSRELAALLAACLQIPADEHTLFLQVARGELRTARLDAIALSPAQLPSLEQVAPALRSNLPLPTTPLVGREPELTAIAELLQNSHCRLMTLIGPGGIGKTRLALQAAADYAATFSSGAFFVSLAPLVGREQIVTAIADALGFVLYGATDRAEQLRHYLHEKALLLVLDNFEHLMGDAAAVGLVGDLLHGAPKIKLLVTSREPLNLHDEWVFEVAGLPVPQSIHGDGIATNSAVQLFLQRAQRARVGFTLTSENSPAIFRICQLVDGLPLGIELAAAWVLTLSCEEIAEELARDIDFLASSSRDIAERHRSMSAVFDHSWQLLSAQEQRVLRSLAIFQGGFGREVAEYVSGASLALLSTLVTKSLLRRSDAKTGRYDLHELVRQYAFDHLRQNDAEYHQIRQLHCQYYTALLARRGMALKGRDRPAVVAELIAEIANLRMAWQWASIQRQVDALNQAADTLFWLYESRSNCREGVPLFGQAVECLQSNVAGGGGLTEITNNQAHTLALGQLLSYQGFFCFRQGQHPQGRTLLQHSLALLRSLDQGAAIPVRTALSNTAAFLGTVVAVMGDYEEGHRLLSEGLALKLTLDDRWGAAFCLRQLGLSAYIAGEYREAYRLLQESLVLSREMGNSWAIASSLNALSLAAYAQNNYREAQELLQEGLILSQSLEDRFNIATSLNGLGLVSQALGDSDKAIAYFQEGIAIWREIGDEGDLAQTFTNLGNILLQQGDLRNAQATYIEALAIAQSAAVTPVLLDSLLGLAALYREDGVAEHALELVAYVLQHSVCPQNIKARATELQGLLVRQLSPEQLASVQQRVVSQSLEARVASLFSGFSLSIDISTTGDCAI